MVPKGFQRVPNCPRLAKDTQRSQVVKGYLVVKGWQRVPKGPRLAKGYLLVKVLKVVQGYQMFLLVQVLQRLLEGYLLSQSQKREHIGPRLAKSSQWSKVGQVQLVDKGWQTVPCGPMLIKGFQRSKVCNQYLVIRLSHFYQHPTL